MEEYNAASNEAEDFASFDDGATSYSRKGPQREAASGGDALGEVLEVLYSEHRYISSLLDKLELESAKLRPGKIPDYHLLLDMVDYLIHYPDQYHHPREDLLYSGMLENNTTFKKHAERLHREHDTLHHYSDELYTELSTITDGRPAQQAELKRRLERYIQGYRQHIAYENREVFPKAKGTINKRNLAQLQKRTHYIDDPLFGTEVLHRYQRLSRSFGAKLGVASAELVAKEMSGIESFIGRLSSAADTAQSLRDSMGQLRKDSWEEQLSTLKEHATLGKRPNIAFLPAALMKNHIRHLRQGFNDMQDILSPQQSESGHNKVRG